ncbi:hypothetical protein JCM5350_007165 [Sporobolomyces pararoseus]
MHIPFIPPELVGEIATHFDAPLNRESEIVEVIENGKSISLVCRDWRWIGQGLRWRFLCIPPSSLQSLLAHFISFPHLAPFLQHLVQPRRGVDEEADADTRWTEPLLTLLPRCQQLKSLDLKGNFGNNLFRIIRSASSLPRLEHFNVFIYGRSTWNGDVEKLWLNGFDSLTTFMILAETLELAPQVSPSMVPRKTELKSLVAVTLDWNCAREDQSALVKPFFSAFDPSVLLWCSLGNSAACPSTFALLGGCPHLVYLSVGMHEDVADETFRSLVEHLPKLLSLEKLQVEVELEDEQESLSVSGLEIGIPLEQVLASFPSTLLDVKLRQLAFSDCNTLQPIEDAPFFAILEPVLQILYSGYDEFRPMRVWKDEVDGEWFAELDALWSDVGEVDDSDEEDDEEEEEF